MKQSKLFNNLLLLISILILVFLFIYPDTVKSSVATGISICSGSLIANLFPFMIVCKVLCRIAMAQKKKPPITVFLLLSLLSGFPNGALIGKELYESGGISKKQAEDFLLFSNFLSPSFCIFFYGKTILGSIKLGLLIFLISLLSGFISSYIVLKNLPIKNSVSRQFTEKEQNISIPSIITDSSHTMLYICAFVTFFLCIGNCAARMISAFTDVSTVQQALICGTFEASAGVATLESTNIANKLLAGTIIISFGGLSAIMQILSVCDNAKLNGNRIIYSKLLSATISIPVFLSFFYLTNLFVK